MLFSPEVVTFAALIVLATVGAIAMILLFPFAVDSGVLLL